MAIYLHPSQKIIYNDPHRFRVVVCGRRFGKTVLSIREMLDYAYYHSGSRVVYLAPTIKQARDICWRELCKEARPLFKGTPNETRLEITILSNGKEPSEIWLRGTENVESLRGQGIDFLVVDEVASMKDWTRTWEEVLRPTLTDTKGQVMFIGTPRGYNHFYDMFDRNKLDSDYASFKFTSYDNPFIPKEEIDKARLEMDDDSFQQEYMAEFRRLVGMVYREWQPDKQFTKVDYDPKLPIELSFDFGVNDPTAIIWFQRNGGEFHIIDYYEAQNASIDHFVSVIKGKPYKQITGAYGDPAGKGRSITTNTSPIDEYRRYDIHIRTKDNVKIAEQIRITHRYIPSLYVSDKLERFRDCMLNYRYPEKPTSIANQSNEEPIHDEFSHAMRAMEYYFVNVDSPSPNYIRPEDLPRYKPVDSVIGI